MSKGAAITALRGHVSELTKGLDYIAALPEVVHAEPSFSHAQLFQAIRSVALNGKLSQAEVDMFNRILQGQANDNVPPVLSPVAQIGLTEADWEWAATKLGSTKAQIRAVWEVEASGKGWFTDVRGDILERDGPGGFLDGPHLPKLLFEAHIFDRYTSGRYRQTHPNLSSATWNQALYVGGQGEWIRLWDAMRLDETAALMSASYGGPQIMGFNHKLAGFGTVQAFVDAMKKSERNHLEAFVNFIINSGLGDELRMVSNIHASNEPFARGYNGTGFKKNEYHIKIARAHDKWQKHYALAA